MTSVIHLSANTSVQAMCGAVAGVKRMGVKWSMSWFIKRMHRVATAPERILSLWSGGEMDGSTFSELDFCVSSFGVGLGVDVPISASVTKLCDMTRL